MNDFDDLGNSLSAEAATISVTSTSDALDQVRGAAVRRRRRNRACARSIGALALVAGGLVAVDAVGGDSGSDSLSIAGPDDTAIDDTIDTTIVDPVDTAGSSAVVDIGVGGVATPVNVVEQAANSVAGPPGDDGYTQWLVAWKDGFLSARQTFTPQPLPTEFPDDIAALFSQPVLDLFADGLPPTIQEATDMLSDAGLLDEVTAVLAAHPEANELVFSQPMTEPEYEVLFTTDGEQWEPIELAFPADIGEIRTVRSTGDRLAVLSQVQMPVSDSTAGTPWENGAISLSTTTDLVDWNVTKLPDEGRPTNLPDVLQYSMNPQGLAATSDGWVATAFGSVDIRLDVIGELFPEIGAAMQEDGGLGYGFGDDGITISIGSVEYDGDGNPVSDEPERQQEFTLTWDELGVDPSDVPGQAMSDDASMWAASWGADPVAVELNEVPYEIVAVGDGFYGLTDTLLHSTDGVTWTELTSPVDVYGVQALLPIGDRVAVIVATEDGSIMYRVSGATDTWEPIELPGVPDDLSANFGSSDAVWFLSPQDLGEPTSITIDADGYALTLSEVFPLTSVLLVDSEGDTIIDETWNPRSDDDPGIIVYTPRGVDVVDPETESVIVSIDNSVMDAAYREAYPMVDEAFDPDVWMLASADGDNWIVDHIGQSPDGEFYGPGTSAINGTTVLVANDQRWQRYDL